MSVALRALDQKNEFFVSDRKKLDWREVISLKNSAEEIWDIDNVNAKRDWGKLLHLVLSEIHYIDQKNEVIDKFYSTGKCDKEDYDKLKVTVNNLLDNTDIMYFFTPKWEVKTEKEILMKNGKTYIPDRLLFSKNKDEAIVIDFKTGERSDKDKDQISEYANALTQMGNTVVKKFLIYTSDPIKIIQL